MGHKLGFIGFGGMAEHHYRMGKREEIAMEPVAVFDIRAERRERAEELGMKAYDNVADFLADKRFDVVVVATPNQFHCLYTCKALEAGYNVICEKPAAMNTAEVEKMIATAERVGKIFTIHQNRRFDEDFRVAKKVYEAGYLGKPYMLESRIESPDGNGCMYNWRGMLDHGGGMFPDWGVHMLDQLLWLIGKPVRSVYAKISTIHSEEVDDYSKLLLTFDDGLTAQVEVATFGPIARPRFNFYGTQGAAVLEEMDWPVMKVRRVSASEYEPNECPAYLESEVITRHQRIHKVKRFEEFYETSNDTEHGWHHYYEHFKNTLDGKEELLVKPEQVLQCMRVIDAAFESARENKVVYLG